MKKLCGLLIAFAVILSLGACKNSGAQSPASGDASIALTVENQNADRTVNWTMSIDNEASTELAVFLRSLDCTGGLCQCSSRIHHRVMLSEDEKYDVQLEKGKVIREGIEHGGQCDLTDGQIQTLRKILNNLEDTANRDSKTEDSDRPMFTCKNTVTIVQKSNAENTGWEWEKAFEDSPSLRLSNFLVSLDYSHVVWKHEPAVYYFVKCEADGYYEISLEYGYVKKEGLYECDLNEAQLKELEEIIREVEELENYYQPPALD